VKSSERKKVLFWGGRSKSQISHHMLMLENDIESVTIFEHTLDKIDFEFSGLHIKDIKELKLNIRNMTHFVVCIGGEHGYARVHTAKTFENLGLKPLELIHPHSYFDKTSAVGVGVQIMPSATIHSFCNIGDYCIINTGATVDHECMMGNGVHVMGSAAIAGRVTIGDFASIGTNATILPNITIGAGAFVGAGAVVTKDVDDYCVVAGSPAKYMRNNTPVFSQESLSQLFD